MSIKSRISALENAGSDGLLSVVVRGGLSSLELNDTARAGAQTWTRAEGEEAAAFRSRGLTGARSAGARVLVWGI